MIVGNLFQQAYTIVDSAIVGHYNGEAALAAVGATSALINLLTGAFIGISDVSGRQRPAGWRRAAVQ